MKRPNSPIVGLWTYHPKTRKSNWPWEILCRPKAVLQKARRVIIAHANSNQGVNCGHSEIWEPVPPFFLIAIRSHGIVENLRGGSTRLLQNPPV